MRIQTAALKSIVRGATIQGSVTLDGAENPDAEEASRDPPFLGHRSRLKPTVARSADQDLAVESSAN